MQKRIVGGVLALVGVILAWSFRAEALDVYGQLRVAFLEQLSSDPSGATSRIYYNTSTNAPKYYNGSAWRTVANTTDSLSNPMDSAGDMIYGGSDGVVTKLDSDTSGRVLVSGGAGAPSWLSTLTSRLIFQYDDAPFLFGADFNSTSLTNSALKVGRMAVPHYTNAEEPLAVVSVASGNGINDIHVGGGDASLNSATSLNFYTAANSTTTNGTNRLSINASGVVAISGLTTNGPIFATNGDGTLNSEATLDRTRGGTGVSSTATFPTSSTNNADFVMKGAVNQTIQGTKHFEETVKVGGGPYYGAIVTDTTDGSDNRSLTISGGGAGGATRGGSIVMYGNEQASFGGNMYVAPGTSGDLYLSSGARFRLSGPGNDILSYVENPVSVGTTPSITQSGGGWQGNVDAGNTYLYYSRVGPMVCFDGSIRWTGTASGTATSSQLQLVTNIPHTSRGYSNFRGEINGLTLPASPVDVNFQMPPGGSYLGIAVNRGGANATAVLASDNTSGTKIIYVSGCYHTNS